MSQIKHHVTGPEYWRSVEHLAQQPEVLALVEQEFPGYDPKELMSTSRRRFLKIMGASMALAGMSLTGCRRWPREELVPQTSNVEGRTPGNPEVYATIMELGGVAAGLLVTSYDGRPIKIEGNPLHPFAKTAQDYASADRYAQATILEMYDPERSRFIIDRTKGAPVNSNVDGLRAALAGVFTGNAADIAVLSESTSSPSALDMRARFTAKFPQAKWYEYEPVSADGELAGLKAATGQAARTRLYLDRADVVFCLDADPIGSHPAHTRYANDWSKRRKTADVGAMSRVYVAESAFTITGSVADERLPIKASRAAAILAGLAAALGVNGAPAANLAEPEKKFVEAAAADLKAAGKNALVVVGGHLAPEFHGAVLAINAALGSYGNTVTLIQQVDRPSHADAIRALADSIKAGTVKTLLVLGGNPAYNAPADLDFAKLLPTVANTIHLSNYEDETSVLCKWHVNRAHFLESWGDGRAYDGTVSIQQPLIYPLYAGLSTIEVLALATGDSVTNGREIVRRTANEQFKVSDAAYRKAIHDGVLEGTAFPTTDVAAKTVAFPAVAEAKDGFEVRFLADAHVYDGRFSNNGWLQEMPDPLSKLTWDNAALISFADAKALGVTNNDVVRITVGGRTLDIAAFILPGQPLGVISLPLGYGRKGGGHIGRDIGFDTYVLRGSDTPAFAPADVKKTGATYTLIATQDHHIIDSTGEWGRTERIGKKFLSGKIVHEGKLVEYKADPESIHPHEHGNLSLQLFDPPFTTPQKHPDAPTAFNDPHAWGMAVDMTTCIGCNACVIACNAENNIPVVGKELVAVNREMHWIRIDRYFKGAIDDPNPEVTYQPMLCVHCENAPCEQVCPVAATLHDTEGLNTMVYNRCIGTRYCSNNCPYKVRRFNYYDYHSNDARSGRFKMPWLGMPDTQQQQSVDPIRRLGYNPEVTVRMRGVMEKCTYCTQRIAAKKIVAKNDFVGGLRASSMVMDGEVITACQQACPTDAIVFGNLNDAESRVTKLHKNKRQYSVLGELNTRPRTRHLAKVRNPNEGLEPVAAPNPEHH